MPPTLAEVRDRGHAIEYQDGVTTVWQSIGAALSGDITGAMLR